MQPTGVQRGQDWWPCPYCRAVNSLRAVTCAVCGAQLRDPDDDLFSPLHAEGAAPSAAPAAPAPEPPPAVAPGAPAPSAPSPAAAGTGPPVDGVNGSVGPPAADAPPPAPDVDRPLWDRRTAEPVGREEPPRVIDATVVQEVTAGSVVLAAKLAPEVRRSVAIPLSVVGSLMSPDEDVVGLVAGTALGRAAVVVLSRRRIIIANGRPDGPVIDLFELTPSLQVRCRHDGDVAALTIFDGSHMVTVDSIADVSTAVELARSIHAARPRS